MTPISIELPHTQHSGTSLIQRIGLGACVIGFLLLFVALTNISAAYPVLLFILSAGLICAGAMIYILPELWQSRPGIKHNNLVKLSGTSRGLLGWLVAVFLTGFYVVLYWFPGQLQNLIRTVDWLSNLLRGKPADQWFLYGTYYTLAILVMGIRMIIKNRHSRYQLVRTLSVMFFQLGFAYLIPAFLVMMNQPEFYFSYFWPLKYSYLFPNDVHWLMNQPGGLGLFMIFWGAVMTFVATPILTYFFGKRWYCSWVCGCGGLAETLGDPYRQLSDKTLKAWKLERITIYSVLIFIVLTTVSLWLNSWTNGGVFHEWSTRLSSWYGFLIGALFSGVIGVGFYPLFGSRVWCRFGCPMAAVLGIFQKYFSRFRITTNGGQCMSCGNCSTYCEMGIDVRSYAQRGENIVRASCVGCGICSAVCPRGVLNLENGPPDTRINFG
ncbi:MAG: 4Fe-4S binding protein [Bacteroidetes bacterium]|nr:4Fe-4S binding protein [Bacteroidota bacterium]